MKRRMLCGIALAGIALAAAAAQAQWQGQGWGPGYGGGMGLGRADGPVSIDVSQIEGGYTVAVTVSGCGGIRDYRSFGTDVAEGEGQERDLAAATTRLLATAREACGFEPRLATRMAQGFEPAFAAWLEEQSAMMMDMNMATDDAMSALENAADCIDADCNAM